MFPDPGDLERIDKRFHRIARELKEFDLQRIEPSEVELTMEDVFGDVGHSASGVLFMGFYSRQGLETALERYGIVEMLRNRGFHDLRTELDLADPYLHRLLIYDGREEAPENLLSELRLRRVSTAEEHEFRPGIRRGSTDFLMIEWLCMQNPRRTFSPERPALPGQRYPGLGIGPEIMELLQIMAERLGLAGILARPQYYHNAALYSLRYHFIDPRAEGRLMALMRDLAGMNLSEASWAVHLDSVIDAERGTPIDWVGREEVFPLNRGVARYFESASYNRERDDCLVKSHFRVDLELFERRKTESDEYLALRGRTSS